MALVHDLGESVVGDITPHCGVSKEEKHKREKVECSMRVLWVMGGLLETSRYVTPYILWYT